MEVEDHPLDYGDFEGTIPKGQYGGGTVMLWDRGFWVPEDGKSAEQSLRDGELKFLLAGEKLQGGWVLVRMKGDRFGGTRTNWLLIKHKDEGAHPGDKDKLLDNDHSVASGRSMEEIAAGKGRGPTPFMLARRKVKPNAIWNSNESDGGAASAPSSTPKTRAKSSARKRSSAAKSGGSKGSSISEGNVVLGVKISNPDKELWPASGDSAAVTKIELARYIAEVGPWMIDHIEGRPCSVIRAPDGIEGQQFFQRHAGPGTPDTVEQVRVSGDRKPYIQIDTVEGLVAMAQMAALEFHPWNSAPGNASLPGRLVFDLDPGPDVPFSATVRAAKELRSRLGDLGLVPFCKTTGGKGLHVVTPLKTGRADAVDWDQAKMFAQTVCAQMAHDSPSLYVIKMTKTLRTGRIFLDYLRNDSTATAVAPLSPRARPGATGVDAADVGAGARGSRSQALHDSHRSGVACPHVGLEGLLFICAFAQSRDQAPRRRRLMAGVSQRGPLRTRKARTKAPAKRPSSKRVPLPDFVEPCLATLVDSVPEGPQWVHEIKFDGYRLQARIDGDDVRLLTRKGLDWTHRFSGLRDALRPAQSWLRSHRRRGGGRGCVRPFKLLAPGRGAGRRRPIRRGRVLRLRSSTLRWRGGQGSAARRSQAVAEGCARAAIKIGAGPVQRASRWRREGDLRAGVRAGARRRHLQTQRQGLIARAETGTGSRPSASKRTSSSSVGISTRIQTRTL